MTDQAAERRAQALAEVNKMQTDLSACQAEIAVLRREADRAEDRIEMLIEERNTYRSTAVLYRDKLVELATAQANIGLLTRKGEEIAMTVRELAERQTPEEAQAEQESARVAVENLPAPAAAP
jgi:uncharacterized coiled-coil DUF342 family protein